MSFLYLTFDPNMPWSLYWFSVRDEWIEISTEFNKEPFYIVHIATINITHGQFFHDKPNVLEISDQKRISGVKFWVFSYDILDIITFFDKLNQAYSIWLSNHPKTMELSPIKFEFKGSKPFANTITWEISSDKILLFKGSKDPIEILYDNINAVNIPPDPSKKENILQISFAKTEPKPELFLQKNLTFEKLKDMLSAIYERIYLYRSNSV